MPNYCENELTQSGSDRLAAEVMKVAERLGASNKDLWEVGNSLATWGWLQGKLAEGLLSPGDYEGEHRRLVIDLGMVYRRHSEATGTDKQQAGTLTEQELTVRMHELINGQNSRTVMTTCIGLAALVTVTGAATSAAVPLDPATMNADTQMLVGKLVDVLGRYVQAKAGAAGT